MKWIVGVVFSAFAAGVAAQVQEVDHALDLSIAARSPADLTRPFLPRSIDEIMNLTDLAPSSKRLRITLLPMESALLKWGDAFTYVIQIENVGTATVVLPWSSDVHAFMQSTRRVPLGYRSAGIGLEVQDAESRVLGYLQSESLYGSEEVSGSLLRFAPGKTAVVRVPGRWAARDAQRDAIMETLAKGSIYLAATLSVPAEDQLYVRSINRLGVRPQP